MIRCPYCGHELSHPLMNGIASCSHCRAFFESTRRNKILSAAWEARKSRIGLSHEVLKFRTKLSDEDINLVMDLVTDEGYSHDELLEVLNRTEQLTA